MKFSFEIIVSYQYVNWEVELGYLEVVVGVFFWFLCIYFYNQVKVVDYFFEWGKNLR